MGMGFAGLADGIVFHQILGWHHLLCSTVDCQVPSVGQLRLQNTQDGYFHLALWLVLVAGTALLFRSARHADQQGGGRVFLGSVLAGGGLFNFIEGIVNHQVLAIHHVYPGHPQQLGIDLLYLANGVAFAAIGWWLVRSGRRPESAQAASPMA